MVGRVYDILLVRHPETSANVEGRFVGRGDAPLTPRGIEQIPLLVDAI
ncbi:MAG: histidine phosphatase family protein, partial [Coriobacteriia bacterium]|nr:histidine phosphatase family protein [Coriobacteriia bacterium]